MSSGSSLELLGVIFIFLVLVSEQDKGVLLLSKDGLNLILGESEDCWDHHWLVPGREAFLIGDSGVDIDVRLKLSEEDLTRLGSAKLSSASSVIGVDKDNLIFNISNWVVSSGEEGIRLISEVGKNKLGVINLLLKTSAVDSGAWGSTLLENPGNDGILGSTTSVLSRFAILEELESRETLDTESLSKLLLLGGIDLGKGVGWII